MEYFCAYLIFINLLALLFCAADKSFAIRKRRRIRERTLFLTAAAGGSVGMLLGMYLCRHKTRHRAFTIGIPCILLLQILILCIGSYLLS